MRLTFVVLAAPLESRYGSLKQLDSVGPAGETIRGELVARVEYRSRLQRIVAPLDR